MMTKLGSVAICLFALHGCGGSDSESKPESTTVTISGQIEGLAGEITVSVNGSNEILTTNGQFTLATPVARETSYTITIVDHPAGLTCFIDNATGTTANSNISNVSISCSGLEGTAYSFSSLGFEQKDPSVLSFAFHLVNRQTNLAVDNLTTSNVRDYLAVYENDSPVSLSESFLEVEPLATLNAEYTTVFAIDISGSIKGDELKQITDSIKTNIMDADGNSLLDPNQRVTILTFDSAVTTIINQSQSISSISAALDAVSVGGNSTNLYGAIAEGVSAWENSISLDLISYGSLILFTDGNDTSSLVSKEEAKSGIGTKDIYFISIGSEADSTVLKEFTDADNIFEIDEFNQLSEIVSSTLAHAKTYEDGLYLLSYATPKRAGEHVLKIEARDDYTCSSAVSESEEQQMSSTGILTDCLDYVEFDFNASGFSDVTPVITISGATRTISETALWRTKVRWTREQADLNWNLFVCQGSITMNTSDDKSSATFTRAPQGLSVAEITVSDNLSGTSTSEYLAMSNDERDFQFDRANISLEDMCNH